MTNIFYSCTIDVISDNQRNNVQYYDVDEVKESVRQGVSKVAGKLSSLANGVMSSLQVLFYFLSL